jgi:molybdenum cofactor synthesis domain-containing protein
MKMRPFGRLLPLATAQRRTWAAIVPVRAKESVALSEGLGRVAAADVRAPRDVPEFARATWDGYALRSRDTAGASGLTPVSLPVVGEVFAEGRYERGLRPGQAVAIATGGALPKGADTVAIFEEAPLLRGTITLDRPRRPGERVAIPGDDFRKGTLLLRRGAVLDAAGLGALGAVGRSTALVLRRPTVGLLPNGNELLPLGAPRRRGAIYEINNLTLGAVVTAAGGVPRPMPPLADDEAGLTRAIRRGIAENDLLVVTGGSSVGEHDFLPTIFPKIGRLLFHGIAVRPGKPTLAAVVGGKLVLGMPGHPTSCLANGFWLLLPAVRRLAGLPGPGWTNGPVRLVGEVPVPNRELSTVVPLHVEGGQGRPTFRDSSAITSLAGANAFLILPPRSPPIAPGSTVDAHLLAAPLGG